MAAAAGSAAASAAAASAAVVAVRGIDGGMSAAELEFLAEFSEIEVQPNFTTAQPYHFIAGKIGPFRAQIPIKVPLWLAVMLKRARKCTIHPPEWLSKETLTTKLEEEQKEAEVLMSVPPAFLEISALIFDCASDDVQDADEVRSLLSDIQDIRQAKMRKQLDLLKSGSIAVQMNNLTDMEINAFRTFVIQAINTFERLYDGADKAVPEE